MTLAELRDVAAKAELPSYAAEQIADWLYNKKISSIEEMTNLSAAKRAWLGKHYEIGRSLPTSSAASADGTLKYTFSAAGSCIETVVIPSKDRSTLCVSSQVGCKMSCVFCMTGRQGFTANLSAADIINQLLSVPESDSLTNIVFMGMGEPFDNTNAVMNALDILTGTYGLGWSPKRITVSTIGARGLKRFLSESSCHLAVSLHAANSNDRYSLVPYEKAVPIRQVIALINQYDFRHQRRVSFEYIVFKGVNDSPQQAIELATMLRNVPCRINLICYHPIPDSHLEGAELHKIEQFRDILSRRGLVCTIRTSRGEDIAAACGMLSSAKKQSA
jgi:23S rRNA (adenine2503-C2)-methyltransferase